MGGYKLYFTGSPKSSRYSFHITEQYDGIISNTHIIDFKIDYLSQFKFGLKYQLIRLSSSNFPNWKNPSFVSDTTKFTYYDNSFYPYLSMYLSSKLVLDYNLLPLYYKFFEEPSYNFMPILQLSYEFGNPDYFKLAPSISFGLMELVEADEVVLDNLSLGFGGSMIRAYGRVVFISLGIEYAIVAGTDIKGTVISYGVKLDISKIGHQLSKLRR